MDDKAIKYIFNDIKITEVAASRAELHRMCVAQNKLKRSLALTVIFTAFYIAGLKACIDEQELKIKKLKKEIEALKSEKGE